MEKLGQLEALERIKVERQSTFVKIKFCGIHFPINPIDEKRQGEEDIYSIPFSKWKEEDQLNVQNTISTKYMELLQLVLQDFQKQLDQGTRLAQLRMPDYFQYVERLQERGLCNVSINNYTRVLCASIRRAKVAGHISVDPFEDRKVLPERSKKVIIFQPDEIKNLIEASATWLVHVIRMALLTAMRRNEIINLHWDKIDGMNDLFKIQNTEDFHPKMGRERYIPITKDLRELFDEIRARHRQEGWECDHIFRDDHGKQLLGDRVTKEFKMVIRGLDFPEELSFHALRRTAATIMYEKTGDLNFVKNALGHSDIKTTQRYIGLSDKKFLERANLVSMEDFVPKNSQE